jgi:HEAT repeat protein
MTSTPEIRMLRVLALADDVPTGAELAPFLTDVDADVRRTALRVLTESAPPDAGVALAIALRDETNEVRMAAIEGLLELRELLEPDDSFCAALALAVRAPDPAVRALTLQLQREHRLGDEGVFARGLEDPDPDVRRHAIAGLVALGSWETAATARHDRDPLVRLHTAKALGTIGHPSGASGLAELAEDDDSRVRAAALEAFAAVGCPPSLASVAIRGLDDESWAVRKGAAVGLSAAPAEMAVEPLLLALQDANLDVRKATVQSLSHWAASLDAVAVALASVLADPDADVRAYARMALP